MCMRGSCGSSQEEVTRSPSGSGNCPCNLEEADELSGIGPFKVQERKMCCTQEENKEWDDCQWYNNLGPGKDDEKFCRSGCPSDRVRVSMDDTWNKDGLFGCSRGARAKCCIPKFQSVEKRDTSQNEVLRDALESFMENPVCSEDGGGWTFNAMLIRGLNSSSPAPAKTMLTHLLKHKRDLKPGHASHPTHVVEDEEHLDLQSLEKRQNSFGKFEQDEVKHLVYLLLMGTASLRQTEIWDGLAPVKYKNLKWENVQKWVNETKAIVKYGYDQLAYLIACHMGDFNES